MSMSACLFVCSHISKTTWPNFTKFLYTLPVAVIQSSSDGVAICYLLPVLSMTSCFHIMALLCVVCVPKWRYNTTVITAEIPTKFLPDDKDLQVVIVSCVRGSKSAVYGCLCRPVPLSECSGNCSCDATAFTPVCGSDGQNYFSPCYAGCQTETRVDNRTVNEAVNATCKMK